MERFCSVEIVDVCTQATYVVVFNKTLEMDAVSSILHVYFSDD